MRTASGSLIVTDVHVRRIVPLAECDEQTAVGDVNPYHWVASLFALCLYAL